MSKIDSLVGVAALSLTLLISGCGESEQQSRAREVHQEIALERRNAEEIDALLKVCKTDVAEDFKHPKMPYLKTCLDYNRALDQGVEDLASKKRCLADLLEEEPSCRRWNEAAAAEAARQKLFSDLVLQNAN